MSDYFLNWRPAYPWSVSPIGLPALALVAVLLVAFTVWTYTGHPNATRRRITIVLALRLAALVVALLTALRPSVGVQEDPKLPSVLVIAVDTSESMKVTDELGSQGRLAAVHAMLKKCQPLLDELATEQNVSVVIYKFSTPDFNEATSKYSPDDQPIGKRSDYGTLLSRTYDRWQGERFMRGFLLIGDGADNGETFSAIAEAAKWGRRGVQLSTFTVGRDDNLLEARDIVVTGVECDPSPVPIKTDVTMIGTVTPTGSRAPAWSRVFFGGKQVETQEFTLDKVKDSKVRITVKARRRGEIKGQARGRPGEERRDCAAQGEQNGENNYSRPT